MPTMTIRPPVLQIQGDIARISADIVFPQETQQLWFECSAEHANKLTAETSDAFLVATMIIAMFKGLDIVVEGPLSSTLYYNLKSQYFDLIRLVFPDTQKITLTAAHLIRTNWGGDGVFTGFSGGIDSFCTYTKHKGPDVPQEHHVSHFLFNNVGAHEEGEDPKARIDNRAKLFTDHYNRLSTDTKSWGVPLIAVNSNLADITDVSFLKSHVHRNIAVAMLFQKACRKYIYSSTYNYADSTVREHHDIAYIDPIGIPLLSTETLACVSYGHQYTRIEKTAITADEPLAYNVLDVCMSHEGHEKSNCTCCPKCLRTALTLEILGKLDAFKSVFDLAKYQQFRSLFICFVLTSPDSLLQEIKAEMVAKKIPIPFFCRFFAAITPNKVINLVFFRSMDNKCTQPHKIVGHIARRLVDKYILRRCWR